MVAEAWEAGFDEFPGYGEGVVGLDVEVAAVLREDGWGDVGPGVSWVLLAVDC